MTEVPTVIVTLGALLFLVAVFGGGITVKEVSIPAISRKLRWFLFPLSVILMAFGIWISFENPFSQAEKGAASIASGMPIPAADTKASLPPTSISPASLVQGIDDFETFDGQFEQLQDENGTVVTCTIDRQVVHNGGSAWRLHWDVIADGWGYCLRPYFNLGSFADWSRGRGVSFWYTADTAGQEVAFWMQIGDPGTGYGLFFKTTVESTSGWVNAEYPWDKFILLPWEEQAVNEFDPSRLNCYGFTVIGTAQPIYLNIRVDDVALLL